MTEATLSSTRWQTLPEATRIRWIRVLDDRTPVPLNVIARWALRTAARRGDTTTVSSITAYALRWHDWGFTPDQWWMLVAALNPNDAELFALEPEAWAGWPALLADHAPLAALKAHHAAQQSATRTTD